jgi:hypothetical protein
MDILVMLEENAEHSSVLAYVNSVPAPLDSERPSRDVVTFYGVPTAELLAYVLAAAVEGHRALWRDTSDAISHLGVWTERGAVGDAAWRDESTGQLVTRDMEIPADTLRATAAQLIAECGQLIRRLAAGLTMPDWPEGARRAISVSLAPAFALSAAAPRSDSMLDSLRESAGLAYDSEGD